MTPEPSYSPTSYPNGWHIDWSTATTSKVMSCRPLSARKDARLWRMVSFGYLRSVGLSTPIYRKDSWEIDWSKRLQKRVWARNPLSKMPSARDWHWIQFSAVQLMGIQWRPAREMTGRYVDGQGYVTLTRRGLTVADEALCHEFGLFRGARQAFVKEHQLAAVKKYRVSLTGKVVRHLNGVKTDNAPNNIVVGTSAENTMDHNTARLMAMFWRNKYEDTLREALKCQSDSKART